MFAPSHRTRRVEALGSRVALSRSKPPVKPSGIVTLGVMDDGVMPALVVGRVGVELLSTPARSPDGPPSNRYLLLYRPGCYPVRFGERRSVALRVARPFNAPGNKVVTGACRFAPPAEERRVSAGGFFTCFAVNF